MRGYELSINVQNFTQKELAKAELLFNVLQGGGLLYFDPSCSPTSKHECYAYSLKIILKIINNM